MDTNHYLNKFKGAAGRLDKKTLAEKQIEVSVGVVLDSVYLKLYKKSWANPSGDPLTAASRIFFSIWINDPAIEEHKLCYNIHAFKLRQLKGYKIQSRQFTDAFRAGFKKYEINWENVSVKHGPLTLMEGWLPMDLEDFEEEMLLLATNFLQMEHLVDDSLAKFRKSEKG